MTIDPAYRDRLDDTYAEGFRSIYAEVLVTAKDRTWLDHAAMAATGHASSTIMCDCEAGISGYVSAEDTPDGRPGVRLQFHVPRFVKNRERALEKALLARLSQNILTCPTTRCFNAIEGDHFFKLGRKIALFGDRHQFRERRFDHDGWVIPILAGEFFLSRRFGYRDGVMGGNLWFFGDSEDAALDAAVAGAKAVNESADVITTFPGGIASSGSKAGSSYDFLIAATYAEYCPTLRDQLGERSRLPEGVQSVMEIILNGKDLDALRTATAAAIEASIATDGLQMISAGNYGGRLGKSFIHLHGAVGWTSAK